MSFGLIAPLLLTALSVAGALVIPRMVGPVAATRIMTLIVVGAGAAITSGLLLVALAGLSHFHDVAARIRWCPALHPDDHGVLPEVAALAAVALAVSSLRGYRYLRAVRRHHSAFADVDGVEIIPTDEPIAVAVPGRPGAVVIGSKLMASLAADEQAALLAHELAHLRFNHHRHVHAAGFMAAMFPPLTPLARTVRLMTERWADESAAQQIGSRSTLARTIARVALMSADSTMPALAFIGSGTSTRVDALMAPQHRHRMAIGILFIASGTILTLAGTSLEFHHLVEFVGHICHR